MVLPKPKPPSQLWREATPEGRVFLERIVIAVHRAWQESEHYSAKHPIERMPIARTVWDDQIGPGQFKLEWQGQGAGEYIAVRVNTDKDRVFHLLGNQAQIHLLSNWLLLGSEEGFPAEMSDADMDRMDFRRHLGFLENAPSTLMWATVQLYECCTFARPIYVALGLDGWGFWEEGQDFVPFAPGIPVPEPFADFDALMLGHPHGDDFRRICRSRNYSFDLDGIVRHWQHRGYGLEIEADGMRFGPLLAFLQRQERNSIDWVIGQAYEAIQRLALLDYTGLPRTVSCAPNHPLHYDAPDMTKDFVDAGVYVARLAWRLREERLTLHGRRFNSAGRPRIAAANKARQTDAKKRQAIIEEYLKTADLTPHVARSSGRLKRRPLALEIEALNLFDGRVKSPIGHKQIEKIIKRLQKNNFSTTL